MYYSSSTCLLALLQSGGSGQFAEVAIRFEPGEAGTGFEFRSDIKGGTVPKEYIPGVTKVRPHGCIGPCTPAEAPSPLRFHVVMLVKFMLSRSTKVLDVGACLWKHYAVLNASTLLQNRLALAASGLWTTYSEQGAC